LSKFIGTVEDTKAKYMASGHPEEAESLGYIEFEVDDVDIEDVNKSVTNSGYIRRLIDKFNTIDVEATVIGESDVEL